MKANLEALLYRRARCYMIKEHQTDPDGGSNNNDIYNMYNINHDLINILSTCIKKVSQGNESLPVPHCIPKLHRI